MEKNDRIVRRSDLLNRFSKSKLEAISGWKMGDDYLILRRNKTFIFQTRVFGFVKSGYYAGNYEFKNDTLKLIFKNDYKPEALKSGILIMKKQNGEDILDNGNCYYLSITKNYIAQN